jgi:hypothetical protein
MRKKKRDIGFITLQGFGEYMNRTICRYCGCPLGFHRSGCRESGKTFEFRGIAHCKRLRE